jgi:hypothetical protein
MASQCSQPVAFHNATLARSEAGELNDGFVGKAIVGLRQLICGLGGHDHLMQFEKERVSLQCSSCGHESPGWFLTATPPRPVLAGDKRRHALVRASFVTDQRRVA